MTSPAAEAQDRVDRLIAALDRTTNTGAAYVGELGARHLGQPIELIMGYPGLDGQPVQVVPDSVTPVPFMGMLFEVHHVQKKGRNWTRLVIRTDERFVALDCTPNVEVTVLT